MKRLLWLILVPLAAVFAAIGIATSFAAKAHAVLPVGGGGEACAVDYVRMYPLTNTIHQGEIGLESHIICNRNANISGSQSLLQYWPWGWLLLAGGTHTKARNGVLGLSMDTWFKCGSLSNLSSNEYKGVAAWYITFPDGFGYTMAQTQTYSAAIFTHCMSPGLAEAS